MAKSKETAAVVVISSKDQTAYTRARNGWLKSAGTYRATIGRIATEYFKEPVTVAAFAKFVKEELSQGEGVTEEMKKERGAIRSRIHDGLSAVNMLAVNPKASKSQRKPRTPKAEEAAGAADAADKAKDVLKAAKPAQSALFTAFTGIVSKASRNTLIRMANEISRILAEMAKEGKEA